MKLSETQLEALKKLKEHNNPFAPYYFIKKQLKKYRFTTMNKLIKEGFAKKIETDGERKDIIITENGILFLERIE